MDKQYGCKEQHNWMSVVTQLEPTINLQQSRWTGISKMIDKMKGEDSLETH